MRFDHLKRREFITLVDRAVRRISSGQGSVSRHLADRHREASGTLLRWAPFAFRRERHWSLSQCSHMHCVNRNQLVFEAAMAAFAKSCGGSDQEAPHRPQGNATLPQGRAVPRRSGWDPGVNVSKKTAWLNPTQSHYDSFEYFLDNQTIFWISEVVLRSARCVAVCRRCRKWICSEKQRE